MKRTEGNIIKGKGKEKKKKERGGEQKQHGH